MFPLLHILKTNLITPNNRVSNATNSPTPKQANHVDRTQLQHLPNPLHWIPKVILLIFSFNPCYICSFPSLESTVTCPPLMQLSRNWRVTCPPSDFFSFTGVFFLSLFSTSSCLVTCHRHLIFPLGICEQCIPNPTFSFFFLLVFLHFSMGHWRNKIKGFDELLFHFHLLKRKEISLDFNMLRLFQLSKIKCIITFGFIYNFDLSARFSSIQTHTCPIFIPVLVSIYSSHVPGPQNSIPPAMNISVSLSVVYSEQQLSCVQKQPMRRKMSLTITDYNAGRTDYLLLDLVQILIWSADPWRVTFTKF